MVIQLIYFRFLRIFVLFFPSQITYLTKYQVFVLFNFKLSYLKGHSSISPSKIIGVMYLCLYIVSNPEAFTDHFKPSDIYFIHLMEERHHFNSFIFLLSISYFLQPSLVALISSMPYLRQYIGHLYDRIT